MLVFNGISRAGSSNNVYIKNASNKANDTKNPRKDKSNNENIKDNADGDNFKSETHSVNEAELTKLYAQYKQQTEQFNTLISSVFKGQGQSNIIANGTPNDDGFSFMDFENNIQEFKNAVKNGEVALTPEQIQQAQDDIGEGGYFSAEKTSERLMEFAKTISGGNPEKIELLRDAVIEGFKQAEEMWGDDFPQISKDTFNMVMDSFDEWASESGIELESIERI